DKILRTGKIRDVEYIKVPHHGSKNGLTRELLDTSMPEVAVISAGKNQWGHPHKEILNLLDSAGILVKRTDLEGDIEIVSDGKRWWIEKP
ncbi:MBL fold metallo-hydrolase, partial [bacterium]|nr:MBL fold metallo-hydrolase [bacterium]